MSQGCDQGAHPKSAFVKGLTFNSGSFHCISNGEDRESKEISWKCPFQYLFFVYCSVEKLMHQRPNPVHFFFQREMARVEKMELCAGNISLKEFRTLHRKDSIVFAPSDQCGGLLFTEVLVPIVENIQIFFRIVEDGKLDILVPRPVLISLVDHPIVR